MPKLDNKPDQLNQAEVDYDQKFNQPMGAGDARSQQSYDDEFNRIVDQEQTSDTFNSTTANNLQGLEQQNATGAPKSQDIPSSERTPWQTSIRPKSTTSSSAGGRIRRAVLSRRGLAVGGGIGGFIAMMMLVIGIILSPSGILLNFKEISTRWAFNKQVIGTSSRTASTLQQKLFGDPSCQDSSRWACRANNGVNERFISRLQAQGFRVVGQTAINSDASRFNITALEVVRDGEVIKRVDASNFIDSFHNDPQFNSLMMRVNSNFAILLRGKAALRVFSKFGIDRKSPVTESPDPEQQAKDFREKQTANSPGGSMSSRAGISDENVDAEQRDATQELINEIDSEDNTQTKQDFVENGSNPDTIPDTNALDNTTELERVGATLGSTVGGTLKGGAMGWLGPLDNACSIYQMMRVLNFTMKALMMAPLLQYYMMFTVTADRMKAGVATPEEMSLMGNAVTMPSIEPATAGLTFSDSPGYQMISQGVVTDPGALSRFSVGPPAVAAFSMVYDFLNTANVGANTCGAITSTPGQIALVTLGLISCAATFGAGCVTGAISGAATGALVAVIALYAVPLIAQAMVGIVTPDTTDPQRSYATGNALGSAASVAGDQVGSGNGFQILKEGEYAQLQQETAAQQHTIARANAINDRRDGAFDRSNPMSFTNQLAAAISPYASKLQSGATGAMVTPFSIIQHAFTDIGAKARAGSVLDPNSSVDDYGGKHCGDPNYAEEGFVTTATCGLVRGPKPESLPPTSLEGEEAHQYGLKNLMSWMQDNNYLEDRTESNSDAEPAEIAKGDYKEYIETCIETSEPITTDGWSLDGSERIGDQCISSEEKYNKFSAAYQYGAAYSGITDIEEGVLGQESGGVQSGGSLVDGDSQELAQAILDSERVDGDPRYISQLQQVAAGDNECKDNPTIAPILVNPLILQLIATLMQDYSLYISSLNRYCTNVLTGSGEGSNHWRDGGGNAVDFSAIGRGQTPNPGADSATGGREIDIELIKEAANILPSGSEFGQVNCRSRIELPGMTQVQDSCNHVHIGVSE